MPRIVSVWLPRWPIRRFLVAQSRTSTPTSTSTLKPVDPDLPFVLTVEAAGGPRIAALNEAAYAEGLAVHDLLADARAKVTTLQVRPADPAADDVALRRLALWATRYTPTVSPWCAPWGEQNGADGFFLDVAGAAHLFGGEETLLADLISRLDRFGLPARLAIADTAGTAWALARFHPDDVAILPSGQEAEALAPLPVAALRVSPDTNATLRRLGFKRIGSLIDKPRAPFAARFENELLTRLDQALGRAAEPLALIAPPPVYHSLRYLMEPIFSQEAIIAVATRLMKDLVHALVRHGVGARALRLALYRVDGEVTTIDVSLTMPTRDPAHVTRLFDLKLERITEAVEFGFGFEALGLAATIVEPMEPTQTDLAPAADGHNEKDCAALIDRLQQRLGPRSVRQLAPVASHLPERAEMAVTGAAPAWPAPQTTRPLFLLSHAEPADVLALVPEGPPQRFRWRGVMHDVAHAQGPERIASEWWRSSQPTRDYYVVEDGGGRRFWLYREGLYERETNSPRWFVQGLFA